MNTRDRLKIAIIISYTLLIICALTLFISLWNKLSMNTDVQVGNGIYFLVLCMVALASAIFIAHMLDEGSSGLTEPSEMNPVGGKTEDTPGVVPEGYTAPFDVDIDLLADVIIPRIDHKENTEEYIERILRNMAQYFEIVQGIFYLKDQKTNLYHSISTFAYASDQKPSSFKIGEGIPGQVAKNKTPMHLTSIPEGYIKIQSGLGKSSPTNLLIIPVLLNKETIGVIELASFRVFDEQTIWSLKNLAKIIGNTIVTKVKARERI